MEWIMSEEPITENQEKNMVAKALATCCPAVKKAFSFVVVIFVMATNEAEEDVDILCRCGDYLESDSSASNDLPPEVFAPSTVRLGYLVYGRHLCDDVEEGPA